MEMIRQVKPDEGEMIRAFAQTVFAAEGGPADFTQLLPKVYRSPQDSARQHLLLEEEGKIQGLLLRTVTQLSAGGRMLPVGHIGSVCVAPAYRGRGAMSRLLSCAVEDLRRDGCALIMLSGQRQRYEHAGFIPTGVKTEFLFEEANVRGEDADGYELRPLDGTADLARAHALFMSDGVHMLRPGEAFADILASWQARPLALYHHGRFTGYCTLVHQADSTVLSEVRLLHAQALAPLCLLLLQQGHGKLKLCLRSGTSEYAQAAARCERYHIGPDHGIRVLDFAAVADVLLPLAAARVPGSFCLGIEGHGGLKLYADTHGAGACPCSLQEAQVVLSYAQAVHLLFSPLSAERQELSPDAPFLAAWLPLPLCLEQNDCY